MPSIDQEFRLTLLFQHLILAWVPLWSWGWMDLKKGLNEDGTVLPISIKIKFKTYEHGE
jgi:hypothetical protein